MIHVDRGLLSSHDVSRPPPAAVPLRLIHIKLSGPRLLTYGVQAIFEALLLRSSDTYGLSTQGTVMTQSHLFPLEASGPEGGKTILPVLQRTISGQGLQRKKGSMNLIIGCKGAANEGGTSIGRGCNITMHPSDPKVSREIQELLLLSIPFLLYHDVDSCRDFCFFISPRAKLAKLSIRAKFLVEID
jgi:hypothetical protein